MFVTRTVSKLDKTVDEGYLCVGVCQSALELGNVVNGTLGVNLQLNKVVVLFI